MAAARRKGARSKAGEAAGKGVYFLGLTVENVRCFKDKQTLDLSDGEGRPARWTVLLGENATGKTTLLQALAAASAWLPSEKWRGRVLRTLFWEPQVFIRVGSIEASLDFRYMVTDSVAEPINSVRARQMRGRIGERGLEFAAEASEPTPVVVAYGPYRRPGKGGFRLSYADDVISLFSIDEPIPSPEYWLLQIDHKARLGGGGANHMKGYRDRIFEAICRILPDVSDLRVQAPSQPQEPPRLETATPDGWIPLQQLGTGLQAQTTWLVDLARRLLAHYPDSPNPLAEPAICLVDELDLHMHPKWQRAIVGRLTELFPNTQFVVTAHSPLIVQAAEDAVPGEAANLVLLRREGDHVVIDNDPVSVRNWRVDQILTSELFGLESARPPHVEKLLEERRAILRNPHRTPADERRLAEMDRQIGDLPSDRAPADAEAMAIIREAAARLRAKP